MNSGYGGQELRAARPRAIIRVQLCREYGAQQWQYAHTIKTVCYSAAAHTGSGRQQALPDDTRQGQLQNRVEVSPMWLPGYVEVLPGFDAEHCPDPVPAGYRWAMVYAGGSSAAHPWIQSELDRVKHLPRLPVWVPTPGHEDPVAVADKFLAWLKAHSVPPISAAPHRPAHVMWDMETGQEPDAAWLNKAADRMAQHGYWNLVYGSISTLFAQPVRAGYIVANPTGQPHMYAHPGARGTQWAVDVRVPGGLIDQDVLDRTTVGQLWMPAG